MKKITDTEMIGITTSRYSLIFSFLQIFINTENPLGEKDCEVVEEHGRVVQSSDDLRGNSVFCIISKFWLFILTSSVTGIPFSMGFATISTSVSFWLSSFLSLRVSSCSVLLNSVYLIAVYAVDNKLRKRPAQ